MQGDDTDSSDEGSEREPHPRRFSPYGYRYNFLDALPASTFGRHLRPNWFGQSVQTNILAKHMAQMRESQLQSIRSMLNPTAGYAQSVLKMTRPSFSLGLFADQSESRLKAIMPSTTVAQSLMRSWPDLNLTKSWIPKIEVGSAAAHALSFLREIDWQRAADNLEQAKWQRILPANLREVSGVRREHLLHVLRDPLPLYAVPRSATVEALLDCDGVAERRRVVGQKRDSILEDCSEVLGQITNPAYRYEVSSLNEAVKVMDSGGWQAGQALATTVMDTFVWKWGRTDEGSRRALTGRNRSESGIDAFDLEAHLVMLPIFHAHETYWPGDDGVLVPRGYNRHASLHSVSRRQYSQRNAVTALMMATSLGWYMHLNY